MEVKLLLLGCIQIFITTTLAAVTIPFTDLVASVIPIKPRPLSELGPTPPRINSEDAILEYYKSQFLQKDLTTSASEFSSPLVLVSSSRTLQVPKFETGSNFGFSEGFLPSVLPSASAPKFYKSKYCFSGTPQTNDVTSIPSIRSLPVVSLKPKRRALGLDSACTPSSVQLDENVRHKTNLPQYTVPYPLQYSFQALPNVLIPANMIYSDLRPMSAPESIYSNTLTPSQNTYTPLVNVPVLTSKIYSNSIEENSNFVESNHNVPKRFSVYQENMAYPQFLDDPNFPPINTFVPPTIPMVVPIYLDQNFNCPAINLEFEKTKHFINLNKNIENTKNIPDILSPIDILLNENNCRISNNKVNFQTSEKAPISCPEELILKTPIASSVKSFPEIESAFATYQRLPNPPTSAYVNMSPTYLETSSITTSSVNDIAKRIIQKILSSLKPYLMSVSKRKPGKKSSRFQRKRKPVRRPQPKTIPTIKSTPVPSKASNTTPVTISNVITPSEFSLQSFPIPDLTFTSTIPTVPSVFDEYPTSTYTSVPVSNIPIADIPSLPPIKVTTLPPMSISDYISPQPCCLSTLPAPNIPPYLFTAEPKVVKVNSLSKNSKTIEKILRLVFLAELLNGENFVDWDALDTVLALLCTS